jgi:cardiolipin synthase A/B
MLPAMATPAVRRVSLIVVFFAVLVAVVLLLVQDQVTLHLRSAVGAAEPEHPAYLAGLLGVQLTDGNRFTVHTNGEQIFPAMLAAIDRAQRRVSFETYIYESGEMAEAFTRAFARAARRGVRVHLVIDAVGGSGIDREHLQQLEEAGCRVARFNTLRWYSIQEVNYRTHRKILVVDGAVAFTGGVGIGDQWMGDAQDEDHWRDTMVEVAGPVARLIEGAFYENFAEAAGAVTPEIDDIVDVPAGEGTVELGTADAEATAFIVRSSPSGGANDMKRLYLMGIAAARRTLDITTPYFVPDASSLWSLEEAVRRGVAIRLLVEGEVTDAKPVKYASHKHYDALLALGIQIYEYQPTMMHAKTFVVDGAWSMFGSANFDNRSLELNDELNVAVTNRDLAARLLADFERDLQASQQITLEAWRRRPLLSKARERFWTAFAELF